MDLDIFKELQRLKKNLKSFDGFNIKLHSIPMDRLERDITDVIDNHNTDENAHDGVLSKVGHKHTVTDVGITWGTEDLEAGVSHLPTGTIYIVHE